MGSEFKGNVSIEIGEDKLGARIRFTPVDGGDRHNLESLKGLLEESKIVFGINKEALKEAVLEFSEAEEPCVSDVIAQGTPPVGKEGKVYAFKPFIVPENLKTVEKKLRSAGKKPVIYKLSKVKVNRDKRVREKGLFKGGREKIITVEEIQEKKVRVEVSPEVEKIGFFAKGDVICSFNQFSGEQITGTDLFGNEIPVPVSTEKEFWAGKNIIQEKSEFIATESGFVRKGKNWLDLVPFANHEWTIRLSKNKADCYVDIIAGHKAASPPSLEDVKKEIKKQGYSEDLLFPDEEIKALLEQGCCSGGAQSFCLSRDREGSFNIDINSAQTEAYLQMSKGRGKGKALNIKEAWKHVQTLNIKGLDISRLKEEIVNFNKSDKMDIRILLAKGEEPQRGEDRRLEVEAVYLNEEETQKIQGRLKEGMSSSFREFPIDKIQKMALVEKGQSLFHLQEQTEGKEGRDIFGNVIKGIEGNDPVLQVYENINILEGKGKSRITGILDYCWEENVYFLRVREHQDARVMVSVAENHMSASVSFLPPQGSGSPVREGLLREALKKKGVVSGLLEEEILRACVLAQEGKIATEHLVAEARIPFKGGGALKFLVGLEPGKKNRVSVEAGCFVAAFAESDEGTPCNVLGEPFLLEAEEGIEAGENLVQEEKEGLRFLKARATGMLCLEKGRLIVKDRKKISGDVSRAMGNVQFPGSIQIAGSVLSGIFIKAGKNLQVHEVVEASLLSAGGSIQVGKGIKGEGKAVLRAGEQIALGFAEQTNLMANGKVKVKKYLMNCMVKCNAEIQGADRGSKILGGTIKVKHGLAVGSLGSKAEMETRISFGQDYLVEDRIRVVDREIEEMHRQLSLMESSLKEAEQKKQQNKLMAYRKKKVEMLKILEKKGIKKFFLQEKFEIHFDSEIKVWETLHPGVIFESHGRSLLIKETHEGVRVYFDQNTGKIKIKKLMNNDQK